ncbi:TPA: DUF551 domain-containing protein [Klebsiella pneumoniae]
MIPDKDLTDDVLDEIIAGAKTSMEQYLALSLKAERKVWRQEGPTDDERIMAIEGIHNCEQCSDEGWVIGEMGITRCACGQADNSPAIPGAEQRIADAVELLKQAAPAMLADNGGPDGPLVGRLKSPVIPDGYVMVPKDLLSELRDWAHPEIEKYCEMWEGRRDSEFPALRKVIADADALLAAAPQPQNAPQNIPEIIPGWIPVSERMPGSQEWVIVFAKWANQQVLCWDDVQNRWTDFEDQSYYADMFTHWMPLPNPPQEVNHG